MRPQARHGTGQPAGAIQWAALCCWLLATNLCALLRCRQRRALPAQLAPLEIQLALRDLNARVGALTQLGADFALKCKLDRFKHGQICRQREGSAYVCAARAGREGACVA